MELRFFLSAVWVWPGWIVSCLLLLSVTPAFGQTKPSPRAALAQATGQARIDLLNKLSEQYRADSLAQAKQFAEEALELALAANLPEWVVKSRISLGVAYRSYGDTKTALDEFLKALVVADSLQAPLLQADALHKIGVAYLFIVEVETALRFALKEEAIWKNLDQTQAPNRAGLADAQNLIGLLYVNRKEYERAESYLLKSLEIARGLKDNDMIYKPLTNLGQAYLRKGNDQVAEKYILEAIKVSEEANNKFGQVSGLLNLSEVHLARRNYPQAKQFAQQALMQAKQIQALPFIRNAYNNLAAIYEQAGEPAQALVYFKEYKVTEDSLINRNSRRRLSELENLYLAEKDKSELIELRNREEQSQIKFLASLLVGALAIAGVLLLLNRNRLKNQAHQRLEALHRNLEKTNEEIAQQNQLIAQINRNLTDSINYARRIQEAIFPPVPDQLVHFDQAFILNLPRDIVSGDFCWVEEVGGPDPETRKVLVAVGDCTGHGVPGAFLTVMCNALLLEITNEVGQLTPSTVLDEMHRRMVHVLRQRQGHLNDGLDLAVCLYAPAQRTLEYAGARIPLLLRRAGQPVEVLRADRPPIGDLLYDEQPRHYQSHQLSLAPGDCFFLATDGYQDQFGSDGNEKFKPHRFRQVLEEVATQHLLDQRQTLQETLEKWRGRQHQTDDILVFGARA
ncbi:MAG: SpoIIE family protein phosphatase [Bernardetiaceae bacterium]|jgi:serine phosphatase RsbU (regulator of sigma subunit)|nr:SpoIIE family protein phosphatase [Bernardetiaceae bacterium]